MKSIDTPIIIADSISPEGIRLITWQLRNWRPIHSELMTHRVFSRNAGSSRARPSQAIIDQVRNDPWGPMHWGENQSGMQADGEVDMQAAALAELGWRHAARNAADEASNLVSLKIHKQVVNRLLEPFTYIDVVLSGTDFANWYALRDHKDAQPEIRELAAQMKEVQAQSNPTLLKPGQWHLPYITVEDINEAGKFLKIGRITRDEPRLEEKLGLLKKVSAARCARVSYKLHDGSNTDFGKDLDLFNRLLVSQPLHASPAEHQATPDGFCTNEAVVAGRQWENPQEHGNFRGWRQFRKMLPNEFVPG